MSGEVDAVSCKLTLTNFAVASSICDGDPGDTGGSIADDEEEEMSVLIDGGVAVVVVVVDVVPGGGPVGGVGKGPNDAALSPATTAPTALLPTPSL